jgi:hypothetical protein
MSFLDSATSVIDAVLTDEGRAALARNDGSFQFTKFAFGDDEVNYGLYDPTASDPDAPLLNLPVLEPISNAKTALRYRLISAPKGTLKISTLTVKPRVATVGFGDTVTFTVETDSGDDPQGYVAASRDTDIGTLVETKVLPTEGVATFTLLTGTNAGSKSGTTVIDLTGLNTGARSTHQLTVSASGT